MKNIYLVPTDKPSRLSYVICTEKSTLTLFEDEMEKGKRFFPQNIYITSERPKKDDWVLYTNPNSGRTFIVKCSEVDSTYFDYYRETLDWRQIPIIWAKKIVLTTDQDLIKDGVQPIDDEFLEWFVKNPSCEFVEVGYGCIRLTETDNEGYWISMPDNQLELKIEEPKQEIIQKFIEKHGITEQQLIDGYKQGLDLIFENASKIDKQETLEEAAKKHAYIELEIENHIERSECIEDFIAGAAWQAERMYSEEEVKLISFSAMDYKQDRIINYTEKVKWFEQFKKK